MNLAFGFKNGFVSKDEFYYIKSKRTCDVFFYLNHKSMSIYKS